MTVFGHTSFNPSQVFYKLRKMNEAKKELLGFNPSQVFYKLRLTQCLKTAVCTVSIPHRYSTNLIFFREAGAGPNCFNPSQVFYKLFVYAAICSVHLQFQSLIGILQTGVCIVISFVAPTVSIPHRYSTNRLSASSYESRYNRFNPSQVFYKLLVDAWDCAGKTQFQSLIGILQTATLTSKIPTFTQFQSLIGILQTLYSFLN